MNTKRVILLTLLIAGLVIARPHVIASEAKQSHRGGVGSTKRQGLINQATTERDVVAQFIGQEPGRLRGMRVKR